MYHKYAPHVEIIFYKSRPDFEGAYVLRKQTVACMCFSFLITAK